MLAGGLLVSCLYAFTFLSPQSDGYRSLVFIGYATFCLFWAYFLVRRPTNIVDPGILLFVSVTIGVVLKVPYLVFNPQAMSKALFVYGSQALVAGGIMIMIACALFLFTYGFLSDRLFKKRNPVNAIYWRENLMVVVCAFALLATGAAGLLAINEIGFSSLANGLSQKRFLDLESSESRFSTSLYLYYKIAISAKVLCYVSFAYLLTATRKRYRGIMVIILVIALVISIVVPIIFNARAHAVLVIVDLIAMYVIFNNGIKLRFMAIATAMTLPLFSALTAARYGDAEYGTFIDSILENRYFLDVMKTSHLMAFFNEKGEFFLGETLIGWMFILVPSSIMPNKPLFLDLGQWLGWNIYGYEVNGIPPGFVAELYINFGYFGAFAGMAIAGILSGLGWRELMLRRKDQPVVLVLGALAVVRFGVFLFNTDFGTFALKIILEAVPAIAIILLTTGKYQIAQGARFNQQRRQPSPIYR